MNAPLTFQAAVYMDDGESPVAVEGPSEDFSTLAKARAWAKQQVAMRTHSVTFSTPKDGFWYAAILRGRYVDPIGDGVPYDFSFESEPDFSEVVR
jgi:hypothetical protein